MKILFTGFDPFGKESVNPSWEAVAALPPRLDGVEIVRRQIPTIFGRAGEVLLEAVLREAPDGVICVGQAGGRRGICPERIAVNLRDSGAADNAGRIARDEPIVPDGPAAYFSALPVKAIAAALNDREIPSSVSNSAGLFVCNDLMYTLLHLRARRFPSLAAGFIHVPFIPEQLPGKPEGTFSLPLPVITRALEIAAAVTAQALAAGMKN